MSTFEERPHFLYRGVCDELDKKNSGKIFASGRTREVIALYDGTTPYDGRFRHGRSAENTSHAHQIASGTYDACAIATSKSLEEACRFASTLITDTQAISSWGWVYVIDSSRLKNHGIESGDLPNARYEHEKEVTLLPQSTEALDPDLILFKLRVDREGQLVDID